MYNIEALGAVTINGLTPLVGKIVSMYGAGFTYSRVKFSAATDPLVVTIVHADGTPFVDSSNVPITRTHPLAAITSLFEYGTSDPEAQTVTADKVQATTFNVKSLIPWALGAAGVYALYRLNFLAGLGFSPAHAKGHTKAPKRGHSKKKS